ncbi:P-loop containing nucleoside triphosphate hydrolase protein [Xylariaceae sp. FL0594]|nr:P-loop containing nucleoside triphosphate hydrolase protein [Xylariaceae sp. FL0594]
MIERAKGYDPNVRDHKVHITICSPGIPRLTFVDLPTFNDSKKEDEDASSRRRQARTALVEKYTKDKNSIILAVVASDQPFPQRVLSMVQRYDEKQERTLGIITKPDLLKHGSQEECEILQLARNQKPGHKLALGWYVLRNGGETESSLSPEERDKREADFFNSGIWPTLPPADVGVPALRKKLPGIIFDYMRNHPYFNDLIQRCESRIPHHQAKVRTWSPTYLESSQEEKLRGLRAHFDKKVCHFKGVAEDAMKGIYSHEFFSVPCPDDNAVQSKK